METILLAAILVAVALPELRLFKQRLRGRLIARRNRRAKR